MPETKPVTTGSQQSVEIKPAKGRPFLQWVGKQPLQRVTAYPAQLVETFSLQPNPLNSPFPSGKGDGGIGPETNPADWPAAYPAGGLLFHGDNKEVLAHLLANGFRGKVKLIYIDPPFNTGVNYVRNITLRNTKMEKIQGQEYSLAEQIQYENNWHIDLYLQDLYERLQLARELLASDGIITIRLDVHFGYLLRMIADEIFGRENFQNEIVVNRIKKNVTLKGRRTIPHAVDYLYIYFKGNDAEYKYVLSELPETKPGYWHNVDSPGIPGPRELTFNGKTYYPSPGAHLKFTQEQANRMWSEGTLRENPTSGKLEYWVPEKDYINLDSNWTDIPGYSFQTGYPTENSEQLLERVILAGSDPYDIVMDFYIGSGTSAAVAQKLGRRWIGCDINKGAIQTTTKRLQAIIQEQADLTLQLPLLKGEGEPEAAGPAQLGFAVYRVNDYDLQIQHNEAVNLACEHLGVARSKTDRFFDGLLGKKLVKIIPFNHPLSPIDLEEIKTELASRPEEGRDVVVVSLGKEIAADAWLEDWNRLRKTSSVPNKIEAIELRSDPRYGGFFQHQPAQAEVKFTRQGYLVKIEIVNFISPSIVVRLKQQSGVLTPHIEDWRSMVDSDMIDTSYDGQVFNITLADVPERKDDFVKGSYTVTMPDGAAALALKITDMLGEEVLVVKTV